MSTARENLGRYESERDWQRLIDMAMGDPPNPWELSEWINHFSWDFSAVYGGPPLLPDYPIPVQEFFKSIGLINGRGRPCSDEQHILKVRQAWIHAVFRNGYEMNLEIAQHCKEQGIPYNGRMLVGTPSENVLGDIADKLQGAKFGLERLRKIIKKRK